MKKVNCPSCGAEIAFQSNLSVYAVCKYCNSMIVRHDVDVESIGTMAVLPDDMSPLQIGTEGQYKGQRFGIIGRMKIAWEDGVWNEWFLNTDDGRKGWLAEAQGSYAISFEVDDSPQSETGQLLHQRVADFLGRGSGNSSNVIDQTPTKVALNPKLGSYLTLDGQRFKVVDIKRATCIGSEGELPFTAAQGRVTFAMDLLGSNGEFACIEILDGKQRVYVGHYVEWNDMRCQNIRPLEGW